MSKDQNKSNNSGKCKQSDNAKKSNRERNPRRGGNEAGRSKNEARGAMTSQSNPVSFYTKYMEFAQDAARIPFAQPLGDVYEVGTVEGSKTRWTDPGIMRLVFSPTVGVSTDFNSPMNRSSVNYYARIRAIQKAFGDYDHQDITMMVLALDSCIMFHALGMRIYGLLRDMTPVNKYYPRGIVTASGVSFKATQSQIQDFRSFLNEFAIQIEQYAIPDNITLIKRHQWMCEGIYTDSTSKRAQTYIFVPRGFWKFNGTAAKGGQLEFVDYVKSGSPAEAASYSIEEFEEIGWSLLNAMTNNADFAQIAGDLYAFYGGATMKLPYIDESYSILPKYDKIVLSQIENAVIAGDWDTGYTPLISQDPSVEANGAILFKPKLKGGASNKSYYEPVRMNMHVDSPTSDDVIEATRLMVTFKTGSNELSSCASEILHFVDIFRVNPETNGIQFRRINSGLLTFDTSEGQVIESAHLRDLTFMASFDWAPRLLVYVNTSGSGAEYCGCTWDIDNSTEVKTSYVETIHAACLYSLFDIATK